MRVLALEGAWFHGCLVSVTCPSTMPQTIRLPTFLWPNLSPDVSDKWSTLKSKNTQTVQSMCVCPPQCILAHLSVCMCVGLSVSYSPQCECACTPLNMSCSPQRVHVCGCTSQGICVCTPQSGYVCTHVCLYTPMSILLIILNGHIRGCLTVSMAMTTTTLIKRNISLWWCLTVQGFSPSWRGA